MGTLSLGAKNAVEVCMGVKPEEHVLIVTDKATYPVGNALKAAAERITSFVDACSGRLRDEAHDESAQRY
jgi:FlaA1/EpsC-like NDP-sugar epimerase